ncbi:MAG TPA: hypothetical protein VKM72_36180 [Thermoanaerobaculia bacterium]|nr:hypothetical protein [Thermoanaerobaculia bacterium]
MSQMTALRTRLRDIVRDLELERDRLRELRDTIQLPPAATSPEDDDEEPNPLLEIRTVIECGLHDCLEPLLRDLLAAVGDQAKSDG